jgi:hypothetical protein
MFADALQNGFSAMLNNNTLDFNCSKLPIDPYAGYCALQIPATQFSSLIFACSKCISLSLVCLETEMMCRNNVTNSHLCEKKNTGIGFQVYLADASDAYRIKMNLITGGLYLFDDLPIYNATIYAQNGSAIPSNTWFEVSFYKVKVH